MEIHPFRGFGLNYFFFKFLSLVCVPDAIDKSMLKTNFVPAGCMRDTVRVGDDGGGVCVCGGG